MKESSEIIKKTINAGKLYPRPTDICNDCNEKIVLCWGPSITQPYWRHLNNESSDHSPNSESYNHKLAKKLLVEYLNKKGKVKFDHDCNNSIIYVPKEATIFKEEVKYKDCRFDIGGLDIDNNLIFGIEIFHTHKTVNIKTRNELAWVEIKAHDVIKMFDNLKQNDYLVVVDYSEKICCGEQLKNLSFEQIAKRLKYMEEQDVYCKDIRKMMIVLHGKYHIEQVWNVRGILCNCEETDCNQCNDDIKDKKDNNYYKLRGELWKEFNKRKKCLKCENKCEYVQYQKPFCIKCYKMIKEDGIFRIKIKKPLDKQDKLRRYFIERNEKIKNNNYDFLDNEKHKCYGNSPWGDTGCIILSLDENNKIIVSKNPNYSCEYNCGTCINFLQKKKPLYGDGSCYCDIIFGKEYMYSHVGSCGM